MSATLAQGSVTFIDTSPTLLTLLEIITNLPVVEPPSLYIDLEGINLGRNGSISILSLHISPTRHTYLIDIHTLGPSAFSTTTDAGISLKTILESTKIAKAIFDIRSDSDALFSLFHISVNHIRDLQLMELGSRTGSKRLFSGLKRCIEYDSPISDAEKAKWGLVKERGRKLFAPEHGGRYEVFNERPLNPDLIQYCHQDVSLLPGLYNVYRTKLYGKGGSFWRFQANADAKARIKLSQSPSFDGSSRDMALGWDEEDIKKRRTAWNKRSMMEAIDFDYEESD